LSVYNYIVYGDCRRKEHALASGTYTVEMSTLRITSAASTCWLQRADDSNSRCRWCGRRSWNTFVVGYRPNLRNCLNCLPPAPPSWLSMMRRPKRMCTC